MLHSAAWPASAAFAVHADSIRTYELESFTFDDGGTASGEIAIDFDALSASPINLVTSTGTVLPEAGYTRPSDALDQLFFGDAAPDGRTYTLIIDTPQTLDFYKDSQEIPITDSVEGNGLGSERELNTNAHLDAVAVPLPSTFWVLLPAIAGLGMIGRRRCMPEFALAVY